MRLGVRHVWEFLTAIWSDFAARVSGGLSFLLAVTALYYQFVADHPKPVLWALAGLCYLIASFSVWYKTHPDLNIEVKEVLLDKNYDDADRNAHYLLQQFVTIMLYVVNTRQENNAIKSYNLVVEVDGRELVGEIITSRDLIRRGVWRDHIDLDTVKGSSLQQASPVEGWLRFLFEGGRDLNDRSFVLTVTDVYKVSYKIKGRLPEYSDEIFRKIPDEAFKS